MASHDVEEKVNWLIEELDKEVLVELIQRLTENILDETQLGYRIHEQKRVLEMRKDPDHEPWMEQR